VTDRDPTERYSVLAARESVNLGQTYARQSCNASDETMANDKCADLGHGMLEQAGETQMQHTYECRLMPSAYSVVDSRYRSLPRPRY
jgi:hypothetical protein